MSARQDEKDRRRRERVERVQAEQVEDVRHRSVVWLDGAAPPIFCAEAAAEMASDFAAFDFGRNPLKLWEIHDASGVKHFVPQGKVLKISATEYE